MNCKHCGKAIIECKVEYKREVEYADRWEIEDEGLFCNNECLRCYLAKKIGHDK